MPTPADSKRLDSPAAGSCGLRLLGVPGLLLGERSIALSAKDAALLGLAALDGPLRSEQVATLLWPRVTAKRADTSLRQRIYRLRREAGTALFETGAVLRLATGVRTDLAEAIERIAQDEHASVGELFGAFDYADSPDLADWVRTQRRQWRERCNAALAAAAARCEAEGAVVRGLAFSMRLVDADPLAEHAQRRLMRLHYLRGDRASAINAFERFEARLKDDTGTRPSAETIELLATIERAAVALPLRRAVAPASLLRPPRLVGRDSERAALERAWAAQHVFLLLGEAGIGKSRLLHEFARGQDGVVSVQSRPGDAGMAYAVLARLLRAVLAAHPPTLTRERTRELALVLPELGSPVAVAGEAQRLLLQHSVEATLVDAQSAGLQALLVDDLHFADEASLEFLRVLTPSEPLTALRWGFAQRPAESRAAVAELRSALEESQRIEAVVLSPLTLEQMAELVESLGLPGLDPARLAPALLRHSGGNPLFALETLKDLLLSGELASIDATSRLPQPATVGALIERRLAQLSPAALKLARVAALAGESFSAALAAAVLDLHPLDIAEPWRELEAAQVIRGDAFAHDLIFEATQASVPAPIARLLHQRIALHLEAGTAAAGRIAPHWVGALEWQRGGAAYAAAARQARSASQRAHEVDCWQAAAHAFDQAGAADLAFDARCESIQALIVVRGVADAQAQIESLLTLAVSPEQRAAALTARATAALMAGDHLVGMAAAVEAGQLARDFDSPWPGFEAARLQAAGLAMAGHPVDGIALIEPYRQRVESDGTPEQRGRFWADYAYVLNAARRLRETAVALDHAITNAQALGDLAELATLTSNLATVKGNLGQVGDALDLARRSLALQHQLGATDGPTGAVAQAYVGVYCGMSGRYAEALEHLDAALLRFARDPQPLWTAVASNHKANLLLELGQFARARQALVYPAPPIDSVRARGATLAARIARALGQPGGPHLETALALLPPGTDPNVRMHALIDAALAPGVGADPASFDDVLRMAVQLEFAGVAMKVRLLRAFAQSRAGQVGAAAAAMQGLVELLPQVQPADLYFGQAWWLAAQVFEASGDGDRSLMALAEGARWVRRVALPNVPDQFRASFLERNPTNRALLAAADRRLR